MGARFVAGSDCGWGAYPFGYFVREIEALARAGLTNMEALMSGTSEAAKALRISDRVGTLEAGKEADVLVVNGDPLADPSKLADVTAVFKRGRLVERRLTV
jgi:imidazolonepropionase-like amidohydrolase